MLKNWVTYMAEEHPNILFAIVCLFLIFSNGLSNI